MMTKKSSSRRKNILIFSILPLLMLMMLALGKPAIAQKMSKELTKVDQGDPISEKDKYYEHAIIHYVTKDGKTKVITYKSMSDEAKSKVPPPPPPPPSDAASKVEKLLPLEKGTVVTIKEGSTVVIRGNDRIEMPPPPPPPAPPKVNGSKGVMGVPPPPPPPPAPAVGEKVPKAPKAPKPPKAEKEKKKMKAKKAAMSAKKEYKIKEKKEAKAAKKKYKTKEKKEKIKFANFVDDGVDIYIDGVKMKSPSDTELEKIDPDDIATVDVVKGKDGKKSIYIVMKK